MVGKPDLATFLAMENRMRPNPITTTLNAIATSQPGTSRGDNRPAGERTPAIRRAMPDPPTQCRPIDARTMTIVVHSLVGDLSRHSALEHNRNTRRAR